MNQRDKRQKRASEPEKADRVARQQAERAQAQPKRGCYQCVFYVSSALLWMRTLVSGFPISGMCANHTDTPGQWRPAPGRPCRNFRPKPRRVEPPEPPNDQIRYIPLTRGLHAIVDADDYEALSRHKWSVQPSRTGTTFYAKRTCHGRLVLMHREIIKAPQGTFVDHINGNGLDNRRCNLRLCTPRQNSCNRSKQRKARHRFIGVHPCGKYTYQATVMHKGETYRAGTFTDEVKAAKARDRLALELHGPFARLNFPPDDPPDP
jgi:hypothetical protein